MNGIDFPLILYANCVVFAKNYQNKNGFTIETNDLNDTQRND